MSVAPEYAALSEASLASLRALGVDVSASPAKPPPPPVVSATLEIAPARTLNAVGEAAAERQLTLVAENAPVRLVYGRERLGAQLVNVLPYGGSIVLQCLWGHALDAVESVTLNDAALPAGSSATHYTGSQVAADATLVAAFAAQGITYGDTLAGLAYSVVSIPAASFTGGLSVAAVVRGRRVFDPRDGGQSQGNPATWTWSDNPSLCLADFITSTLYGAGKTVDWATVEAAADANDADLGGGETHRTLGWSLAQPQAVSSVIETLRTYAGVFLPRRGAQYLLLPDAPAASAATYTHAAGQIAAFGAIAKRDLGDVPTQVEIVYTDTAQLPWRDRSAFAPEAPPAVRRLSTVRLNGVQRYSQAYREAVERLNKLALNDLSVPVTIFDAGLKHEAGDVVTLTIPGGISGKAFRITATPEPAGPGLWSLACTEYDPAAYSTEVRTEPTYADTTLASPGTPPALAAFTAAEEIYQGENGLWFSRARLTITAPAYAWTAGYQVELYDAGALVDAGYTVSASYASPPVQDGRTYTARARLVSTIGAVGAWSSDSFTADGKLAVPGDVPAVSGFEVGGDIYLAWQPAVDVDIWRYELRWGTTSDTWASAALLDRVDALRYISKGVLTAGVRRIFVKALDSVGQYSANAAHVDVTVTIDPDALRTRYDTFTNPTLTALAAVVFRGNPVTYYDTEHGTAWNTLYGSALDTYTSALITYQADATNAWQSEVYDFGTDLTGDWAAAITFASLSGAATLTLQLASAAAYPTFTDHTALPAKTTARYARIKVSTTGEMRVTGGTAAVECYAVTRKEYGTVAVPATGVPTVTLADHYFARRSITVTPVDNGAAARYAVVDNVTLHATNDNTFDVYLFDGAGNRVAGDVDWKFEGV